MRQRRKIIIGYHQTLKYQGFTFLLSYLHLSVETSSIWLAIASIFKIIALIIDNPKNTVVVRTHYDYVRFYLSIFDGLGNLLHFQFFCFITQFAFICCW